MFGGDLLEGNRPDELSGLRDRAKAKEKLRTHGGPSRPCCSKNLRKDFQRPINGWDKQSRFT
jgi:hypothetical protein